MAAHVPSSERDPSSFSNTWQVKTAHLHLNLTVDFERGILHGEALHTIKIAEKSSEFILDTAGLEIHTVHLYPDLDTWKLQQAPDVPHLPRASSHAHHAETSTLDTESKINHLSFRLNNPHPIFGSALHISLPETQAGSELLIGIRYSTSPQSTGLQWLNPAQTADKSHPYMFSQFQAIHARTAVPVQDTPSNKFTYSAQLTVPKPLIALMSAPNLSDKSVDSPVDPNAHVFSFNQPTPIPSYLLAFAVGKLERRAFSDRCGVWSEPSMVDKGAWEFADTDKYLSIAESIAGPYVWKTYDLLLLPPSFPYGGMENPNLTFVTPTLLAGDRSLAGVVVHEIAHSWSGNLTTSHNWQHFWLNEGFTVFLERKVLKALKDAPTAALDSIIGWRSLEDAVERFGANHPYTILNVPLTNIDPDDAFSVVPYEKGFNLLWALECLIGEERMNAFLKSYFSHFSYSTVTTQQFQQFFLDFCTEAERTKIASSFDWDKWLHAPGLPPTPSFDPSLMQDAEALADKWLKNPTEMTNEAQPVDVLKWETDQIVVFLQRIRAEQKKSSDPTSFAPLIEGLDRLYHFTNNRNAEIRFEWLELIIHARMTAQYPAVMSFATEQGRMKFVRPLYRDLFQSGGAEGQSLAVNTFKQHRCNYHAICAKMVARDLQIEQ